METNAEPYQCGQYPEIRERCRDAVAAVIPTVAART
jgi:hypothetical protein